MAFPGSILIASQHTTALCQTLKRSLFRHRNARLSKVRLIHVLNFVWLLLTYTNQFDRQAHCAFAISYQANGLADFAILFQRQDEVVFLLTA